MRMTNQIAGQGANQAEIAAMHRAVVLGGGFAGAMDVRVVERRAVARGRASVAARVRAAAAMMAPDADVRYELVARLRKSIEAAAYRVAAEDVAEKVMGAMGW
jgi:anti-sigma28 factor (negative regulator of flagellin synthesis)